MNSATERMSWLTPWKSFGLLSFSAREYPVATGSMNTKSDWSRREYSFSTSLCGGGPGFPKSSIGLTRCGPKVPRWSHTELEPGPPLKEKVIGRVVESGKVGSVSC